MPGFFTLRGFATNLLRGNRRRNIFFFFQFRFDFSFCQKSAERKSPMKYFFFSIPFWPGIQTWALCLIGQYVIYQTTATLINSHKISDKPGCNPASAPMSPGRRTSSDLYTHRTGTMFVKKSVKMNSVACQLSVNQVLIASY